MRRVIHLGIDGGSFAVLDALAAIGVMPEHERLRAEAGCAVLRSTVPWFTVPGWVTWMTGVRAERHGLISWTTASPRDLWSGQGRARLITSEDIRYPTVFGLASDAGIRVVSVNMPVTFPPRRLNGAMVSGFPAPPDRTRSSHPPWLLDRYPGYRIDLDESVDAVIDRGGRDRRISDQQVESYASALASMADARHRLSMDLMGRDTGLISVVYVGVDRLSHIAWPQVEAVLGGRAVTSGERAVRHYFATLDRLLGATRRAAHDSLFLVTSDHGQGPAPPREFAPNAWLRERGWLVLRGQRIRRAAHAVTWPRVRRWVWTRWRRAKRMAPDRSPHVSWEESVAYAVPVPHCRVLGISVRGGREVLDDVARGLLEVRDPETGVPPVERVVICEEVCSGYARSTFPDLLAFLTPDFGANSKVDGPTFRTTPDGPSGYHEPEGVVMATGPDVSPGWHDDVSIADVAPTLLATLGVEPPDDIDGTAIPWIAPLGTLRQVDATTEVGMSAVLQEEEEELIRGHLRTLGYID